MLQGLVHCHQCGYAFYGKPISRKAAKGQTRTYAYYRCLGTDAYRFGGERVCTNAQVRTDLLDVTVWREVQGVLAHPERVAEEYQRRLQTTTAGTHQVQATLEAQLGKVRQGLARLIDSYAEGLLEKHEFEPRITRLRQRLTQLEEQRQQLIDVTALQTEIRLIVGRSEDFAAKIDAGLEDSDWLSKREIRSSTVGQQLVRTSLSSWTTLAVGMKSSSARSACTGVAHPVLVASVMRPITPATCPAARSGAPETPPSQPAPPDPLATAVPWLRCRTGWR